MDTGETVSVAGLDSQEMEGILRDWAHSQSPQQDFTEWKMAAFTMPAQMKRGPFFAPGELVLCRPAPLSDELANRPGSFKPLQVWSFDLKREVLVNRGMLSLQTGPFEAAESDDLLPEDSSDGDDGTATA